MQVEGEETKLSCPSGCPLVPSRAPIWGAGHMPWGFHGPGDLENVGTTVKVKSSRHLQWHLSITVETKQRHCVCSVGVKRRLRFTAFCSLHDRLPWLRHITTAQNGCPASQVVVCRRSCSFGPSQFMEWTRLLLPYLIACVGTSNLTDNFWPLDGIGSDQVSNYKSQVVISSFTIKVEVQK